MILAFVVLLCAVLFTAAFSAGCTPQGHRHPLVHVHAFDPTCATDGNTEHWYCRECNRYFKDEGFTEIRQLSVVIKAHGEHIWTDLVVNGETVGRRCSECRAEEYFEAV